LHEAARLAEDLDLPSGDLRLEQSFRGGTGAFAKAHGSIRVVDPVNFVFSGRVGI
jgi:hypothetical protein